MNRRRPSTAVEDRTPGRVEPIDDLADLLALPGVVEEVELRSGTGVCAPVSYTHLTLPTKA